jgi:hypothetical protein
MKKSEIREPSEEAAQRRMLSPVRGDSKLAQQFIAGKQNGKYI